MTDTEAKRWRESELKHGRLAMIAALAIPFSESFHPIYPNVEGTNSLTFTLPLTHTHTLAVPDPNPITGAISTL